MYRHATGRAVYSRSILGEHGSRKWREAVIADFDAGDTEATLQAKAKATAIELARVGAPFAVMPPGPRWKPKPRLGASESFDGIPISK